MSPLSNFKGPGYFCIQSQPNSGSVDQYNEWNGSEHGPPRLKLDFLVNGHGYKSTDQDPPSYLATYELKKISGFDEPQYTILREKRLPREQELLDQKLNFLDRRVYADISTRGQVEGPAPIMMSVAFVVKDEHVDELHRWYEEEHTPDLMKIPGWLRSRRFQLIEGDDQRPGYTELLAVHEFEKINGLDGKEHEFAKSRPWRNRVLTLVESRKNQRYEFMQNADSIDYWKPPALANSMSTNHLINGVHKTFTSGTQLSVS